MWHWYHSLSFVSSVFIEFFLRCDYFLQLNNKQNLANAYYLVLYIYNEDYMSSKKFIYHNDIMNQKHLPMVKQKKLLVLKNEIPAKMAVTKVCS